MKDRKLMKVLSFIDPKFIHEAEFSAVSAPVRPGLSRRKLTLLVLAACLVFAAASTAYAVNLFGIRALFQTQYRELPEAAEPYIQKETIAETAEAGWSCEITESLADDASIMVTVAIHGGDRYILAPTYASPTDCVDVIGLDGTQTLGDYASEQGKTLLFVGASIKKVGDLEGINGSQRMQSLSASEMIILSSTEQTVSTENPNAVCQVYALEDGSEDVQRIELPFTLNAAPTISSDMVYHPVTPDAIPGLIVGDMTVTHTALGYNIRMKETFTDQEKFFEIMKIEIDGITYKNGGGSIWNDDGNCYFEANMCQGTFGENLIVHYYDWNMQPIGEITFRK